MVDTHALPIVDVHCHPFEKQGELTPERFSELVSFSGGSVDYMAQGGVKPDESLVRELQRVRQDTVYFCFLMHELAGFLGCEPNLDSVVAARNDAVHD